MLWVASHKTDNDGFLLAALETIHTTQLQTQEAILEHLREQGELSVVRCDHLKRIVSTIHT